MDKVTVIGQRANERMLLDKWQVLLPGRVAIKQGTQRLQTVGAVRQGDVAGPFDGVAAMAMSQVQQPL